VSIAISYTTCTVDTDRREMLDIPSSIKHYGTPLGIGVHHGTIPEMRNQRLVPSVTGELG
jgi:hypothetical protein